MIKNSLLYCALFVGCLACTDSKRGENTHMQIEKKTAKVQKSAGEELFSMNCTACHSTGKDVVVGPGLAGVTKRRPKEWTVAFIRNSQAVIASGDTYAKSIFEKYNKAIMTSFNFSEKEMGDLYQYLESLK